MKNNKRFLLISPKNRTVYNFRGDLIRDIKAKGYDVSVTGPNRDNIDRVEALGVDFIEVPMQKNGINPLSDLKYLWRLYSLLRKGNFDVTLGYTIKPVIYGAIAAKLARVPKRISMITGAGYLFTATSAKARAIKSVAKLLYRAGLASAQKVIFQNTDDLQEFTEHHLVKRSKTGLVNGSGVNMQYFAPVVLPAEAVFLMISRALYSKGVREYLEAAKMVKEKRPQTRIMLLGAIEEMPDCLTPAEVQPYIDSGIIEYYPETTDVRLYISQASVFVLPSYREGTPRTVLESMAMGRPIITTDAPGCRSTVVDGQNGFLVPIKDSEALAEKMIWCIDHPDRLPEMGENSHRICAEKFEVGKVNAAMLELMGI